MVIFPRTWAIIRNIMTHFNYSKTTIPILFVFLTIWVWELNAQTLPEDAFTYYIEKNYDGGLEQFFVDIDNYSIYPHQSLERGSVGIYQLVIIINKDGTLKNVECISGSDPYLRYALEILFRERVNYWKQHASDVIQIQFKFAVGCHINNLDEDLIAFVNIVGKNKNLDKEKKIISTYRLTRLLDKALRKRDIEDATMYCEQLQYRMPHDTYYNNLLKSLKEGNFK